MNLENLKFCIKRGSHKIYAENVTEYRDVFRMKNFAFADGKMQFAAFGEEEYNHFWCSDMRTVSLQKNYAVIWDDRSVVCLPRNSYQLYEVIGLGDPLLRQKKYIGDDLEGFCCTLITQERRTEVKELAEEKYEQLLQKVQAGLPEPTISAFFEDPAPLAYIKTGTWHRTPSHMERFLSGAVNYIIGIFGKPDNEIDILVENSRIKFGGDSEADSGDESVETLSDASSLDVGVPPPPPPPPLPPPPQFPPTPSKPRAPCYDSAAQINSGNKFGSAYSSDITGDGPDECGESDGPGECGESDSEIWDPKSGDMNSDSADEYWDPNEFILPSPGKVCRPSPASPVII